MVLDYSMMQWVLSIVVGVSLSRFINTLALIGRKKDQVKFDFLLISILFATTTQMIYLWFNSPGYFSNIEGIYVFNHANLRYGYRVFIAKFECASDGWHS